MGYRIEYGDQPVEWNPGKIRWGRVLGYAALLFAGMCMMSACFWPQSREALMDWFFPGDTAVIRQALTRMAAGLRAGEELEEAILVFCREILSGA